MKNRLVLASVTVIGFIIFAAWWYARPPGQVSSTTRIQLEEQLVADFPANFPIFPQSRLVYSYQKEFEGKADYEAEWTYTGRVSDVMAWYLENLPLYDWEIVSPPDNPDDLGEQFLIAASEHNTVYLIIEDHNRSGKVEIYAEFPIAFRQE